MSDDFVDLVPCQSSDPASAFPAIPVIFANVDEVLFDGFSDPIMDGVVYGVSLRVLGGSVDYVLQFIPHLTH